MTGKRKAERELIPVTYTPTTALASATSLLFVLWFFDWVGWIDHPSIEPWVLVGIQTVVTYIAFRWFVHQA